MSRLLSLALLVSLAACESSKGSPVVPTLKKEGEPCDTDESCETGRCDPPPGSVRVCVRACDSGCRADEVCTQLLPNRFDCQPDPYLECLKCKSCGCWKRTSDLRY